jgi:hypothetical protein
LENTGHKDLRGKLSLPRIRKFWTPDFPASSGPTRLSFPGEAEKIKL